MMITVIRRLAHWMTRRHHRDRIDEMDLKPNPSTRGEKAQRANVIVVGIDASPSSWNAYSWSRGEAKRMGGRIVAVYVSPVSDFGYAMAVAAGAIADGPTLTYDRSALAANDIAARLRTECADTGVDPAVDLDFVHAKGDVAAELLRIAAAESADLIVVGRSSKPLHALAGSLGRRIIGKRNAPVIVVVP
jgi:nucleotide-binding universal stress UspA family protein